MVLPGEIIPMPKKRAKKEPPTIQGVAAQHFAAQQKREVEAAQQALAAINQPPAPEPPEPPETHNGPIYDDLAMDQGNDPADSSDGEGQRVVANRRDYYRDPTYQERTLREEAHWQAVLPKVFLAFMPCSRQTYQWCDPVLWNQDFNSTYKCKNWQKQTVVVNAVDFTSRKKLSVEVCDCTSDLVRLIRLGYMGSKPVVPRTAFSIRLLRFHHTLWKYSSVRLSAFTDTMDEYLDP
ncbi:uncharacterized protein MELLADRAFT_56378 [Melampsora larici-populina 98AG31]|uniref:CxC1-like cysteine cluster associated with KDZ transposases domain-containing protein n=1 Tax=Melampsora larici-populina (strain 98AG31 / pathotype 3-4-7) TaxID=747676 RepID=F4RQJ1_MELLP|nr:uncharacterized protein MELLADRAFT_56378 [Melampsora larici-populina 98AG31]EGG05307.1 hypothetical protein MELLADRAFT_56378 [Melampsora larici-populina 98AG31]